jgi:hypothetical protein
MMTAINWLHYQAQAAAWSSLALVVTTIGWAIEAGLLVEAEAGSEPRAAPTYIDAHAAHSQPFRRGRSGASQPGLRLTLVHARTPGAPQDTVRVLSTGRGRQSHNRGRTLKPYAATPSRIPSALRYTQRPS